VPPLDFTRRTALYRLYDTANVLLYVGVAFDPGARWLAHRGDKPWWPQVARNTVEWFDARLLALEAEAQAIEAERPLHNRLGIDRPLPEAKASRASASLNRVFRLDTETWEAFGRACEARGISRSDALRLHIKAEVAAFEREQRRIARESAAVGDGA
jgi:hypothetical protein